MCALHACFSKLSLGFLHPKIYFSTMFSPKQAPKNLLKKIKVNPFIPLNNLKISSKIKNNSKHKFLDIISTFSCNFKKKNTRMKLLLFNGLLTSRLTALIVRIDVNRDFLFLPSEFDYSFFLS